jgi:pimeloyl-ACP methyl ester carboxylesterase
MSIYPTGKEWLVDIEGDSLNVRQDGRSGGIPIVLIHAFAGSLRQWDDVADTLAADHHVIRIDLLGHGRSGKPVGGYSMPEQATRVAKLMTLLGAEQFFAIGQSGGGNVVVALLENPAHAARVKGAMVIGTPPDMSFVNLPTLANIYSVPLLGRLMWRITSRKMVSDTMASLFAPGFGAVPLIVVDDFQRMTRHSYVQAKAALEGYAHAQPLSARVSNSSAPLHVVFGEQDQWIPPACTAQWQRASRASVVLMPGIGHTPPLEAPGDLAQIVGEFAHGVGSL